jgi:hypothetical protein
LVAHPLREKLVKIGARIVRHDRYVAFHLVEVPGAVFAVITGAAEIRPWKQGPVTLSRGAAVGSGPG